MKQTIVAILVIVTIIGMLGYVIPDDTWTVDETVKYTGEESIPMNVKYPITTEFYVEYEGHLTGDSGIIEITLYADRSIYCIADGEYNPDCEGVKWKCTGRTETSSSYSIGNGKNCGSMIIYNTGLATLYIGGKSFNGTWK